MDLITKIKTVLVQPRKFFRKLKEKEIGPAFKYFAAVSLFFVVLGFLIQLFFGSYVLSMMTSWLGLPAFPEQSLASIIVQTILGYSLGLAASFVGATFLHVWIMIFGGKVDFTKTYQLSVYSSTPHYLFSWIPFFGMLSGIYTIVLLIIGTQETYKLSRKRTILMYVVPYVIMWLSVLFFLALALFIFNNNPGLLTEALKASTAQP